MTAFPSRALNQSTAHPISKVAAPFRVILVGNYPRDQQESMQRFSQAMREGLERLGITVELLFPPVWLGRVGSSTLSGIGKWLAYLDKYLVFPILLHRRIFATRRLHRGDSVIVHICDHSNAMYHTAASSAPVVITCHDLLAVRGALGEDTDCPASPAGKWLQRWIRQSLAHASIIACDSFATKADADRLIDLTRGARTRHLPIGLNHPYQPLSPSESTARLAQIPSLRLPYILHVGSNLRRKNREGVLRIFAKVASRWNGQLVFAGQSLSPELRALADTLLVTDRIIEIRKPDNDLLEALYHQATALLFPSRFEGFGWPIIEAQACGCPVVCSDSGPLPEVAGDAGLICPVDDEEGLAQAVLRLTDNAERARWSELSLINVKRFTAEQMVQEYLQLYHEAARGQE